MFFFIMMALLESLFIIILFGDFFKVGKLISVSFVFSNNIWVVCSQLLSVEDIPICNGSQNTFGEPWFVKGALFFSRCIAIWSMRIKSIIKNFHKFITESVYTTKDTAQSWS